MPPSPHHALRSNALRLAGLGALLALAFVFAACGGEDSPGGDAPSAEGNGGTGASDDGEVEPFAASPLGQSLLDGAYLEVAEGGAYSVTVLAGLPTGNVSETVYTIDPAATGVGDLPGARSADSPVRGFEVTFDEAADGVAWSVRYALPMDAIPEDARVTSTQGYRDGDASAADRLAAFLTGARAASAQEDSGWDVVAQGVLKEGVLAGAKAHWESADLPGDTLTTGTDSVLNVAGALSLNKKFREWQERIASLRACAENPTNPLTIRQYQEDPAARQRVMDAVAEAERELKANTLVRFIGALNSQAGGLAGVSWLGFILGPATSWADAELAKVTQQYVDDLGALVTPCDDDEDDEKDNSRDRWAGTITRTTVITEEWDRERGGGDSDRTVTSHREEVRLEERWVIPANGPLDEHGRVIATWSGIYTSSMEEDQTFYGTRSCAGERGRYVEERRSTLQRGGSAFRPDTVRVGVFPDEVRFSSGGAQTVDGAILEVETSYREATEACEPSVLEDESEVRRSMLIGQRLDVEAPLGDDPEHFSGSMTETQQVEPRGERTVTIEWDLRLVKEGSGPGGS